MLPTSKYLIDECVTHHVQTRTHPDIVRSVDVLGEGATDEEIQTYAKKHNLTIITKDYKFARILSQQNQDVILLLFKNQSMQLARPDREIRGLERLIFDDLTRYLINKEGLIIP